LQIILVIMNSNLLIKGGKRAQVGEVRKHGGVDMKKTATGWVPVGDGKSKKSGGKGPRPGTKAETALKMIKQGKPTREIADKLGVTGGFLHKLKAMYAPEAASTKKPGQQKLSKPKPKPEPAPKQEYSDDIEEDSLEEESSKKDGGDNFEESLLLDKQNPEVRKRYNNFRLKSDRIRYDKDLQKYKESQEDYAGLSTEVAQLEVDLMSFFDDPDQTLLISAGGAGVGKSYSFRSAAKEAGVKRYDTSKEKDKGDDSEEEDDDSIDDDSAEGEEDAHQYVELGSPKSDKEFREMLKKYNGKTLWFDDADDILTQKEFLNTLKKATGGGNEEPRAVKNPDGTGTFNFTGKIVVMTNKNLTTLYHGPSGSDVKAVTSRGRVSDIHATVSEQVKHMEKILPHMKLKGMAGLSTEQQKKVKSFLLERIKAKAGELDPDTFTTRSLDKASTALYTYMNLVSRAEKNPALKEKFSEILKKTPESVVDKELLKSRESLLIDEIFSTGALGM
jgi:hypothetical protein